jgi:hypothetical protein
VIGLLKVAARFDGTGGRSFRPYARTYANGEITHYLRDHGFAIKVPPSWRDLYASGQKLLREGLPPHAVAERLGITAERWREIQEACSITVIALQSDTGWRTAGVGASAPTAVVDRCYRLGSHRRAPGKLRPAQNGHHRTHQSHGCRQSIGQLLGPQKGVQGLSAQARAHCPGQGAISSCGP